MQLGSDNLRIRGRVVALADGRDRIAAASDTMYAVFDAARGTCLHRVYESARALGFSHDSAALAVGDFHVRVLDVKTGELRWQVRVDSQARTILWTADDRFLVLGCYARVVILEAATGATVASVAVDSLSGIAIAGDAVVYRRHQTIYALSWDGEVRVITSNAPHIQMGFGPDRLVVTPSTARELVWQTFDGTELARVPADVHYYDRHEADRACGRLAIVTNDVVSLYTPDGNVRAIGTLPSSFALVALGEHRVLAGASDGRLALLAIDGGARLDATPPAPTSLAFVADARLACAGEAGAVLRDLAGGDVLAELGPYEHVQTAGERILAWGKQGARTFDETGECIAELTTLPIGLGAIAFDGVVALAPVKTTATPMIFDERGAHVRTHAGNGIDVKYSSSSHNPWVTEDPAAIEGLVFLTPTRLLAFYENGTCEYDGETRIDRPYIPLPRSVATLDDYVVVGDGGYHCVHRVVAGSVEREPAFELRHMTRCAARGHLIAGGTEAGQVVLYDARTGEAIATHQTHQWNVRAIAIDPTGSLVASSSDDGTLIVRRVESH